MRRILFIYPIMALVLAALPVNPAGAVETRPAPATIEVDADCEVLATPDMATLNLEIVTQAPQAQAASEENARQAEALLAAVKKLLGPKEKIQTLGYRVDPVYQTEKDKPRTIAAYQASHRLQVKLLEVNKLGPVIDTAMKNGANRLEGPFWSNSRQEELLQQAAVLALNRGRDLAQALAQASGLKIRRVVKISTSHPLPRPMAGEGVMRAAAAPAATPIEVKDQKFISHIQAVFELAP